MSMEFDSKFADEIIGLLGEKEGHDLLGALSGEPAVSVRVNEAKSRLTVNGRRVAWCGNGFYLDNRPAFTFDPLLHAGLYYVQDASSMFIGHVLRQIAGDNAVTYLDLCAAPGGKTTAALDVVSGKSLVVANEIDRQRAQILRENVIKWGRVNCVVTNDTPEKLGQLKNFFDIVAADMPCSGEGMFRKDEEAVRQWSPALVERCAARQRDIVDSVWDALKPGGFFVYSTCTFNRSENEEIIDYIIDNYGAEPIEISVPSEWKIHGGIGTSAYCYRFLPHLTEGEGLFMAVLRKPGQNQGCRIRIGKEKNVAVPKQCKALIKAGCGVEPCADGDLVVARPSEMRQQILAVTQNVNTILSGVPMATIKGNDIVPEHSLAVSTILDREYFPVVDVDYGETVDFLRGVILRPRQNLARGYCLVSYKGSPLGWVKNIGNRMNNCYPKEWRIRSSFVPDVSPEVLYGFYREESAE